MRIEYGVHGVAGRVNDASRRLNAVLHRHPDVHQHDVRAMLDREYHGFCAICRGSDDVRSRAECGEVLRIPADDLLVVDDERRHHGLVPSGRSLDHESTALGGAAGECACERRAVSHPDQTVARLGLADRRSRAVVADA